MKKISKKENLGITLVALVITIIILLILAGITISQLANNGLFDRSKTAKEESENAIAKEEIELAKYENEIESYVNGDRGTVTLTQEQYEKLLNPWEYINTIQITNGSGSINISKNYKKVKIITDWNNIIESTEFHTANETKYATCGSAGSFLDTTHNLPYLHYFNATQSGNTLSFSNFGWGMASTKALRSFTGQLYGIPE